MAPLSNAKEKLLEWIQPLVSSTEYQQTTKEIEHFFAPGGAAEVLQERLLEWDQNRQGNWLTPFWDNLYLKHRDSLPLTSNFNVLLHPGKEKDIATIAGRVSFLVTTLYHDLIDEKVAPASIKGRPLDMSQYKDIFRSVRIPQENKDRYYVANPTKKNNHIVMISKNNVYQLPVTNEDGILYHADKLAEAIETTILTDNTLGQHVGIFTAAERDLAAETYNSLKKSQMNQDTLQVIADALVIISIDEESNDSKEAIENVMLDPTNKYFDKTIQIVITKQGQLGFNVEHAVVDGSSIATVIRHISQGLEKALPQAHVTGQQPVIKKKEWLVTEEVSQMLKEIEEEYDKRSTDYAMLSKTFTDFGAEQIKQMRISPDAFFHMALQLAQYRTYGKLRSVYEPVSIRFFYEGRTECARATSMEKKDLVEAIESGLESNEALYKRMQVASDAHSKRIKECQQGLGIERHLYGLEQIYHLYGEELGIEVLPGFYKDKGYRALRYDFISTSGIAYENAIYRMFSPVKVDGHGLAYFLLDDSITLNISSFSDNARNGKILQKHMIKALRELKSIAEEQDS